MSRRYSTLLGLGLSGLGLLALPVLVAGTSGRDDLMVEVPAERRFSVAPLRSLASPAASVAPARAVLRRALGPAEPGLELTTWTADYGPAYHREVTWPTLVGPFIDEDEFVCGYSVHAGAALFDTAGAGRGLAALLTRRLREKLPPSLDFPEYDVHVPMPALRRVELGVRLGPGRVSFSLELRFADGTRFALRRIPVKLGAAHGILTVSRSGRLAPPIFEGPLRNRLLAEGGERVALLGGLLGGLFGPLGVMAGVIAGDGVGRDAADSMITRGAEALATEKVDEALRELALGMARLTQPLHPFSSRPEDELMVAVAAEPAVSRSGITLPLCARLRVGAPRTDDAVPGPVALNQPRVEAPSSPAAALSLALNADALEQLMFYLWQSGGLGQLGTSPLVLEGLATEVREAAFDFRGLRPGLPPTFASTDHASGLPFVVGDVALGAMGAKTVVAHGRVDLGVASDHDAVTLSATVPDVRVNCVELEGGRARLTPCLADLLPLARDRMGARPRAYAWGSSELLAKLPALGFEGVRLELSTLRISTSMNPARLDVSANARFE